MLRSTLTHGRRAHHILAPAMLAAMLALGSAGPAQADVRAGVTAWEAGDYNRAVAEWRPLAIAGDADAQFNLAQAYKLGRGVPQDLNQAVDWFRRAAAQGHLQSEDNLGLVLYEMGQKDEALPWLQRSSVRGEPRAQYVYAAELFNGERLTRDWPRAYALMKRASDAGLQRASAALVQMDQHIPLEQRQQGLAMAQTMEASEGQARMAAMTTTLPPAAPRVPTVRPADVPPSQPGVSYTPPPVSGGPIATLPIATGPIGTAGAPPGALPPGALPPGYVPSAPIATAPVASVPLPPASAPVDVAGVGPGLSATAGVTVHSGVPDAARSNVHAGTPPGMTRTPAATPAPRRSAPAAAAGGAWRVQLGAFGERSRATALWSRLSGRLDGAQPYYISAGSITRLQAGPYASRSAATSACAAVRGQADCIVVSAR